MRKPLIAGNWKMYLDAEEAKALALAISKVKYDSLKTDVLVAPSFTNIYPVYEILRAENPSIAVAAQNIYIEPEGAYTGAVSLSMIKSAGARAVILGHSERRNIFNESDELINQKVHKVIDAGLTAILCVGELLDEREAKVAVEVVLSQLGKDLYNVRDLSQVVIAYEPVWAIGTGKTATPQDAESMHKAIREFIAKVYGHGEADKLRILYGGSVKPDNIKALMAEPDVDGALVGGASLKADSFEKIILI